MKLIYLDNAYIEKEGSVYASISIGQTHSMSFKENSLSLLHYICMNAVLCLLAANSFEKYGNIAVSLGLKIVSK